MTDRRAPRHAILLIEDDPVAAAAIKQLLSVCDYDCLHVTNREEAGPVIRAGHFCLILMDLQILPGSKSIEPLVEAGQGALEDARGEFPGRSKRDKHLMQILMMSGIRKGMPDAVRVMQEGADDYLVKPLGDNPIPFRDVLRRALRHSGRMDHTRCAKVTARARLARPLKARPGHAMEGKRSALTLAVTGRTSGTRSEVKVGESSALLTSAPLFALLKLVRAQEQGGEGWLDRAEVVRGDHGHKLFSRLKKELGGVQICENNKDRAYRLDPGIAVQVDWARLTSHGNERVRALAQQAMAEGDSRSA